MLITTDENHNDETIDWPLYFTSVILKGVASFGSSLKCFIGRTYRGLTIAERDLSLYKVNSIVIQKAFSSSSKLRSVAEKFATEPEVGKMSALFTFIMDTNNTLCVDLAGISAFPEEEEVLILPLSIFIVTKIDRTDPSGVVKIELKAFTSEEILGSTVPQMLGMANLIHLMKSTGNPFGRLGLTIPTTSMLNGDLFKSGLNQSDNNAENQQNNENKNNDESQHSNENDNCDEEQNSVEITESNKSNENDKDDTCNKDSSDD
ncbi:unnamed protein product [Rotaria sp. Silwood2]|nr:unnamed protein product [Rotaria sp. Silwood2]CAF4604107.1 unnamed protein product [Rotaria sp. Silwood2]